MVPDARIPELLQRWQELRRQGQLVSAEELCRDCPELIGEMHRHLASGHFAQPEPAFAGLVEGYTLVHELGRGAFGAVWKATGPGGFPVALKFVRLDHQASGHELRSLELMRDIRHPYLLGLFGAWQRGAWLIIAMELADGTLGQRLKAVVQQGQPGIAFAELLRYMEEAARGLDYLNEHGIQHRDVKPQNLLLVGGGVKVADFGLAKFLEHSIASNTGAMTPAYAAPEFLQGQTSATSDQYALAVTYYQLRSGRLPFTGHLAQILDGHRRHLADVSVLPQAAERTAVARALAKDPLARWPSCQAFVAALAGVAAEVSTSSGEEPPQPAGQEPEPTPPPGPEATPAGAPSRRRPRQRPQSDPPSTTSGKAIACLVLGLLSFCLPILPIVQAWIVGFMGLREIRRSGGRRKGRWLAYAGMLTSVLGSVVGLWAFGTLKSSVPHFGGAGSRSTSRGDLKRIGLALDNYHEAYGKYPPAVIRPSGGEAYSWRVALLPFLKEQALYRQYNQNEPWDSPGNQEVLASIPSVYGSSRKGKPGMTFYQVFVGPGTPFGEPGGIKRSKISGLDGTWDTMLVVEAREAVPWTKPEDLPYAPDRPLSSLGSPSGNPFLALFADGRVHTIKQDTEEKTLRTLITYNDGQAVDPNVLGD
jgi:serine/threonine protein kinase